MSFKNPPRHPSPPSSENSSSRQKINSKLVDFLSVRQERLRQKRRKTERILFKTFLQVCAIERSGKSKFLDVIDVSEEGCSFQIPYDPQKPWPKHNGEFPLRLYFTSNTYLELFVKIENTQRVINEEGQFVRYGCSIDTRTQSYPAFQLFVGFLRLYAEQSHQERRNGTSFY